MKQLNTRDLSEIISKKGELKLDIYNNTLSTLKMLKNSAQQIVSEIEPLITSKYQIPIKFKDRGDFEFEIMFAGDILVFMMHSNIFEFSRNDEIMKIPYIRKDISRSYCGIINIYNFLADSFKYNRTNDLGYLIGRVFINKDSHYYIEGKREISMMYNDFSSSVVTPESIQQILLCSMLYTINFDLLTPPYDEVKIVTVDEMQTNFDNMKITTAKRLGFTFQADDSK